MDYFLSILFLFLFEAGKTTSQGTDSEEGRNEGIRCFEQMIHHGDINNLLIDVTTPERVDHFCRLHSGLQRCARGNEHFMSVEENTEYLKKTSGVHSFYVNVCPPGTDITAEYKENAACFRFIKNEILSCGSDLPDLNSYEMKNDLRFRCCALKTHRECLKKAASEKCGNEAASVIEKIHFRYFDRKAKECNSTSFECDEDNPTTDEQQTTVTKWNSHSTKRHLPTTDEQQTTGSKWNSPSTKWKFPETREYELLTEKDLKSTTISDWSRSSQHGQRKKHDHNDGITLTVPPAIRILSCFASILLLKL